MKPLKSSVFHRYFLSVEFFRGLYLVHFDGALEKFDPSSIFPESGIFRGPHLINSRGNFWEVRTFIDVFQMLIFSEVHTWYISMKLLRSLIQHRDSLSMKCFRGPHLVNFEETLEKLDFSSIFSKYGIFKRSILSTFLKKPLRSFVFYRYFLSVEFSRGPHSVISMKLLGSWILYRYLLSVEFLRSPHSLHSRWNTWGVWTFIDIFQVWKFFRDPHLVHFWWNPWGVWTLIDIFQMCWILSEVHT